MGFVGIDPKRMLPSDDLISTLIDTMSVIMRGGSEPNHILSPFL